MGESRPLSSEGIVSRTTSDEALHDVLQALLEEMREHRSDLRQMRETMPTAAHAPYLTTREVAAMFQVSQDTVRRRVAAGDWPAIVIGRQARFGPEELTAIRQFLLKRVPERPMTRSERRKQSERIRSLLAKF